MNAALASRAFEKWSRLAPFQPLVRGRLQRNFPARTLQVTGEMEAISTFSSTVGSPGSLTEALEGDSVFVNVGEHPTESLVWKRENFLAPHVLLMVPGNPGAVAYYHEFLATVRKRVGLDMDIYAVQHVNHCLTPYITSELYSLQDQIDHKLSLLDKLVALYPSDTRFHLMGHSVGAYMCLQLLKARGQALRQKDQLGRAMLLFPTLMDLKNTPNAVWCAPLCRWLPRTVAGLAAALLQWLPESALLWAVQKCTAQTPAHAAITARLIHQSVALNTLYMAWHEMATIEALDFDTINTFIDNLIFYYGTWDKWVPLRMWRDTKEWWPNAAIHLCDQELPHAFVLGHGSAMGSKVAAWLEADVHGEAPIVVPVVANGA